MSWIDPKTRFEVGIPKTQIKYVAKTVHLTYQDLLLRIRIMLNDLLFNIIEDLKVWIDIYVPKRTGQLRNSLKDNLESSGIIKGGNLLKIILGSHLDYAEAVNEMITSQVRHLGELAYAYYYGYGPGHSKIILNDPSAIGHFFDELLKYAKDRILLLMTRYTDMYFGISGRENVLIRHRIEMESKQ